MKIVAINGSPRKNGNTATLCKEFLRGSESAGNNIETEIINLYDLKYTGCKSCFGCKRIKVDTYGKCVIKDDLQTILDKVANADGIVLGSPLYFGEMTSQLKAFLERLLFPFHTYEEGYRSIAPKKMPISMIYTMNVTEEQMKTYEYDGNLSNMQNCIEHVFTKPNILYSFNTYQFNNYAYYKVEAFSESVKAEHKKTQFPIDCQNAFEAGKEMDK
ncbi:flavodoxin [Clostridium beijerinckii]|nr:flavodoxin [Clostridium beijerinckii]